MKISVSFLLKNTVWTIGAYGLVQALRLVTNILLARLLAPQLFGVMLIVNSIRVGIEFFSDVGIGQNIVYHKSANEPDFYNTAWTLQAIRGFFIWIVSLILAAPVAHFYHISELLFIVPLMSFTSVLAGFSSISLILAQKRLLIARLNAFDVMMAFIGSAAVVLFAYLSPTIWAVTFAFLFGCTVSTVGTFFLLPGVKHRFLLSKVYVWEIVHYGKWVFAASIVYFLSSNFDRLYLAKVVSLGQLGVYGIARSIADAIGAAVSRFGNHVLFPLIASNSKLPRSELRQQLVSIRAKFLLMTGLGFSVFAAASDLPIKIFYDDRYQAASWMLPVLVIGSWFSVLSYINESMLLGLGKPSYSAMSNMTKFIFLLSVLPLSVAAFGLFGGIVAVSFSDLFRYFPILIGQRREELSFGTQDLLITLLIFALIGVWEVLRFAFGFGYAFENLTIPASGLLGFFFRVQQS